MSSGGNGWTESDLLHWSARPLDVNFIQVRYRFVTTIDVEKAALSMALEQSVCRLDYPGVDFSRWTARVVAVKDLGPAQQEDFHPFSSRYGPLLASRAWKGLRKGETTIAFPLTLFGDDLVCMMSVILGETARMGYLGALRIVQIHCPTEVIPVTWGPRTGIAGIRKKLGVPHRPLLVRSARPACGIPIEVMERIGREVLRGGFDMLKDDELTFDSPVHPSIERFQRMVRLTREVEQETGEAKMFIANIIASSARALEMADRAAEAGADALMVAPILQGLDMPALVSRRTGLPVLAHNCCDDLFHRHPRIGIAPEVWILLQRLGGTDMVFLPGEVCTSGGNFTASSSYAASALHPLVRPSLPFIAGGKRAEFLSDYIKELGTTDFALIAATAVDEHPGGLEAGAREFRQAAEMFSRPAPELLK